MVRFHVMKSYRFSLNLSIRYIIQWLNNQPTKQPSFTLQIIVSWVMTLDGHVYGLISAYTHGVISQKTTIWNFIRVWLQSYGTCMCRLPLYSMTYEKREWKCCRQMEEVNVPAAVLPLFIKRQSCVLISLHYFYSIKCLHWHALPCCACIFTSLATDK